MKKGIVLEVHDEHVTILTPEGEFLKSRKQKGQVDLGEEIVFFPLHRTEDHGKGKSFSIFRVKWAVISVLTAIILAFSLYPKYANNQVYAYVSVDVNPSIELGVNKDMKVIYLEAYNEEGKNIINQLGNWENKELTIVSVQLFDLFREKGYLTENSEVLIASVMTEKANIDWNSFMQAEITSISNKIQQDKVSITTLETTSAERTEAIKEGISPGKYVQKERNTELVDNDDTSQTEIVPTIPVNTKPLHIKHTNANVGEDLVAVKRVEPQAVNEEKEVKEQGKVKQKEENKQQKQEQKEIDKLHKQEEKKNPGQHKQEEKKNPGQQKHEEKKHHEHQKIEKKQNQTNGKAEKAETKNEPSKGNPTNEKVKGKPDSPGKGKQDDKKKDDHKRGNN